MSEKVKLGDIIKPRKEKVLPAEFPDMPFIGMEHVEAHTMRLLGTVPAVTMKSAANRFYAGDVLYGRLRPYLNKVYKPQCDGLCSAEFIVFPKTEGIHPDFLRYRLNSQDLVSFASHLDTGDRPRVNFDGLSSFEFILPSTYEDQKQIVAEIEKQFSRLDEAVASLKRIQANLKRYKAAVLKSAVEGKLTEQWRKDHPDAEPADQLLKRILAERRAKWEAEELAKMKAKDVRAGLKPAPTLSDSWKKKYKEPVGPDIANLPELPKGWVWARAEQVSDFITKGTTPSADKLLEGDGDIRFLKVYNLTFSGRLNYNYKAAFVDQSVHQGDLARSKVATGDVLINIVGPPLGQVSVVPVEIEEANINQAIARFRTLNGVSSWFLAYTLMTGSVMSWAIKRAKTTAGQSNLTLELCRELPIPLPSFVEQNQVVAEVERYLSVTEELETTIETNLKRAERLRQTILKEAFSEQ